MANRYWVGGTATWDATAGSKWSTTSGGGGGAAVPTAIDNVFFNAASGAVTVTLSGTLTCLSFDASGFTGTFTPGTSIIQSGGGSFNGNGKTFYEVQLSVAGELLGANTFTNLTVTGGYLSLAANQTVSGTFTANGTSVSDRLFITSNIAATRAVITAATVSCTYADFHMIQGAGAGSWNLSAITGGSGNAGGNSGITFTTAQSNYWVGNGGDWSDVTNHWANASGGTANTGRIPLLQDTAYFDAASFSSASQTVNMDRTRVASIICTGIDNTPTFDFTGLEFSFYGSLVLGDLVITGLDAAIFYGDGLDQITSSGLELFEAGSTATLVIDKVTGTVALGDDMIYTASTGVSVTVSSGTFSLAGHNLTVDRLVVSAGATLLPSTGTLEITGSGSSLSFSATANITACGSTIKFTNDSTTDKTFYGGGKTFNNIWNATANTGILKIDGSNTFADIKADAGRTIKFTAGTTTTYRSLTLLGTSGNNVVISSITGSTHTLTHTGTVPVDCDYVTLSYSIATPGGICFAGSHSTNSGNNTGWIFTDRPNIFLDTGV